ncbi:uncharacterized protein PHACADRAFT_118086 [Phanerochaete carnosa HHB-10118-sp]|uniref:AB hydrolase-1 domain-containing protein n=1 Tax=Phanerochaete carnosa (strain HHB-10118-sp) TaxID=650164 RepID=K5VXX0_PHACS|nr:uncharacterized protein PHACADRAFT_118086 [Phanerochaete carnosa HHB-10118-sp]EKM56413.1 hypothetical protein PHACADRAFT_118086 [Phanerochaete carnosa HHB-10118-sp]
MEASLYKDVVISRGLTYNYYFSPAQSSKPTLLFCHGFPSTSYDWRHIVPRLKDKGYGVLALDMLGYGGTDKPTDPAAYVPSLICKDIIDVLDAEKIEGVIAVGHDWGCQATSRLANYYPERILAYVFFALSFLQVLSPEESQMLQGFLKKQLGYETFGYWSFMSEPDAHEILLAHIDSVVSISFAHDPKILRDRACPTGALKRTLLEDFTAPLPSYLSEEDAKHFVETFRRDGFAAPVCWYKVVTSQLAAEDDQQIPSERKFPPARAPIYFGATKNDEVCAPIIGYTVFAHEAFSKHSVTMKEYDSDHWLILSHADEIVDDLEEWIEGTVVTKVTP